MTFCVWLLALSIMFSRFIHVVTWTRTSFLFFLKFFWPHCTACGIFPDQGSNPCRVPCIGRWILNHCTTREAPPQKLLNLQKSCKNSPKDTPISTEIHQFLTFCHVFFFYIYVCVFFFFWAIWELIADITIYHPYKNLNTELPYDPAIPLLGIYPK